jgi:hypothetical protein
MIDFTGLSACSSHALGFSLDAQLRQLMQKWQGF